MQRGARDHRALARRLLPDLEFARHALIMVGGSGLAQALPVLASPILTRQYAPSDFGAFGLFLSVVAVVTIFATGRYEVAILLPAEEDQALNALALAAGLACAMGLALVPLVVILRTQIVQLFQLDGGGWWLYLVPAQVALLGVYQSVSYWFNRQKAYGVMATNRVVRATVAVGLMVVLGLGAAPNGLILGTFAAQALTTLLLTWACWRRAGALRASVSLGRIRAVAARYARFARFSAPGDTVNAVSAQLPMLLIGSLFGPIATGYYSFTQRVLAAPSGVIATAIGDVFRQRAAQEIVARGNCRDAWRRTFVVLLIVSVGVFVPLGLLAPDLFAFAFGPEWRQSGVYAQIMAPLFMIGFVASVLGRTTSIAERQREDLIWQLVLLPLVFVALLAGARLGDPLYSIAFHTTVYALMYLVYLWMSFTYSGGQLEPSTTRGTAAR